MNSEVFSRIVFAGILCTATAACSARTSIGGDMPPPGRSPSEASFSDGTVMSGVLSLEINELDESERLAFSFIPTSTHNQTFDVFLNAVEFERSELANLFSGATVDLSEAQQRIGAGNYSDPDVMDIDDLVWYQVRNASLEIDEESLPTLILGLRSVGEEQADETVTFRGLLQVTCRPASGQQDPQFASPFCSGLMQEVPEIDSLVD